MRGKSERTEMHRNGETCPRPNQLRVTVSMLSLRGLAPYSALLSDIALSATAGRRILLPGLGPPCREAIDFRLYRAGRLANELRMMIAGVSVTLLPPFARALEVRVHISCH